MVWGVGGRDGTTQGARDRGASKQREGRKREVFKGDKQMQGCSGWKTGGQAGKEQKGGSFAQRTTAGGRAGASGRGHTHALLATHAAAKELERTCCFTQIIVCAYHKVLLQTFACRLYLHVIGKPKKQIVVSSQTDRGGGSCSWSYWPPGRRRTCNRGRGR